MTIETMDTPVPASDEGRHGLEDHGLEPSGKVYWNSSPARLYEESFARGDGSLVHMGAIATVTAPHTGRSPNDRFVVRDDNSEEPVDWGAVNVPLSPEHFGTLREDIVQVGHQSMSRPRVPDASTDSVSCVHERP